MLDDDEAAVEQPEAEFVEEALYCVDHGSAGHWPTVAGYLADQVRWQAAEIEHLHSRVRELETRIPTGFIEALD